MKCSAVLAVVLSFGHVAGGYVRGSGRLSNQTFRERSLMEEGGDFSPLSCNQGLDKATCRNWTEVHGMEDKSELVVIGCGECIQMDVPDSIILSEGLDIQGKLVFPENYELILRAPMIVVQGELEMSSTKAVDGNPSIRIIMTGGGDNTFVPIDNNSGNCGGPCSAGKKALVVAGGRMNVKGLPEGTPAWTKLYDVERSMKSETPVESSNPYVAPASIAGCPFQGVYYNINFRDGCEVSDTFAASLGAKVNCSDTAFQVIDRTSTFHGPYLDMKYFRACMEPNRKYILTFQLRLKKFGTPAGTSTGCQDDGTNCIVVEHEYMVAELNRRPRMPLWIERPSFETKYGELLTIALDYSFSDEELDVTNAYQLFRINGLSDGVDIEIERFTFFLPGRDLYPPVGELCTELAPWTGDAEHAGFGSPFPFYSTHPWIIATIEEEDDIPRNGFYQLRGRNDRPNSDSGLAWDLETACLQLGDYVWFSVDVRVREGSQDGQFVLNPVLRVEYGAEESATYYRLVDCPPIYSSGWNTCAGFFQIPPEMLNSTVSKVQGRLTGTSMMNFDVDNISMNIQGSDPDILIVENSVMDRWAPGAEVLVTSHTTDFDGHQVRQIIEVEVHDDGPFVKLHLDAPLPRPTTLLDSKEMAVEVALLSRNIVFEGGSDANPLDGGHFWVFHTPRVNQHVEGIEFKNFGQQGTLGRYPIHFHFCSDSEGSVVLKNSVRDSNQRGIVVHGTDKLLVEENVIFNTYGHGFVVEDGIEIDNIFLNNLGAFTRAVEITIPDNGLNGEETDMLPATFWATNPSNHWIGNVAAGSEHSGFWFEILVRGPRAYLLDDVVDPRRQSLGTFLNNTAHSNFDRGFRSYPHGFLPPETARLLDFRAFRNKKKGVFFHLTENVAIVGGLFADNGVALDLDRSENITVTKTKIIGRSEIYSQLEYYQGAPSLCYFDDLIGLELHTFVRRTQNNGAVIDVSFEGFDADTCGRTAHITLDNEMRLGTFDWFTTLEKVSFSNQPILIDFCEAADVGIIDAYLTDLDGDVRDSADPTKGSGTIMSNSSLMTAFVDSSQCTSKPEGCYAYCNLCFRTVRFHVDPAGTKGIELEVCADGGSPCVRITGSTDPTDYPTASTNFRVYNAHLPPGMYSAAFFSGENEVWPTFADQTYEDKLCPTGFEDGAVDLRVSSLKPGDCLSMIRNGDMEGQDGSLWLSKFTGVYAAANAGISQSTAIKDTERYGERDAIVQFVDSRCFSLNSKGRSYEISAWFKLVDNYEGNFECKLDQGGCPEIRIATHARTWTSVATLVPQVYENGFQLLHGIFVVEEDLGRSYVEFSIVRNRYDYNMVVDNVSMTILPDTHHDHTTCSDDLVMNGNFAGGDAKFWSDSTGSLLLSGQHNNFVLEITDGDGRVNVKTGCFEEGLRYIVSIEYKILDESDHPFFCDPWAEFGEGMCPLSRLVAYKGGSFSEVQIVARAIEADDSGDWSLIYGIFTASFDQSEADKLILQIEGTPSSFTYVLNSASLRLMPLSAEVCETNMVANGDFSMGVAGFWSGIRSTLATTSQGLGDEKALLAFGREDTGSGPRFDSLDLLNLQCLESASIVEVSAQMKLLEAGTSNSATCDTESTMPSVDACPALRIELEDRHGNVIVDELLRGYPQPWDANGWNEFRAEFDLPAANAWDGSVESVRFHFRAFPETNDLVVDNFVVRKVA